MYVPKFHENNNNINENLTSRAIADYSKQQNMYLTNSGLHCSFGVNFDTICPRNS